MVLLVTGLCQITSYDYINLLCEHESLIFLYLQGFVYKYKEDSNKLISYYSFDVDILDV